MTKVEKHLKSESPEQSATPAVAGGGESMPLLATKLHRPQLQARFLRRQRLIDQLEEGRELQLVLVSAPAGYGKSTMVVEWLEESDRPVAWLSLDPGDSNLSVFLSYVMSSIETLFPGACAVTRGALAAPEFPSARVLARHLANDLDAIDASFTLALDDYHCIEGSAVHDLIDEFLTYPVADVHLVIVSRHDPPLPLTSLRAKSRLVEIRFDDLRFSREEAAALMEDLLGRPLSDVALERLMEFTEGWVAGLQLVALAMRHQPEPEAFFSKLEGSIPDIRDYLLSEVLAQQPPALQECILKTSVVDRFSAAFCEGVCENSEGCPLAGEPMMRNLTETGIFIVPLDAEGKWFRYHHLFQDLLRAQFERDAGVDGVAPLHSRASQWFESLGSAREAIDHALKAGDLVRAAEVVEKRQIAEFNADRWFVVRDWLERIPAEVQEGRPAILLAQAWIRYNQRRLPEIAALVEQAESCLSEADEDEREGLRGQINFNKTILRFSQGDAEGVLELVGKAQRQLPPEFVFVRAELERFWGMGHQMSGQGEQAVAQLERRIRDESEAHPLMVARRISTICFLHLMACQTAALQQATMRLRAVSEKNALGFTGVWATFIHAISCFESGEFEAARSHFREVTEQRHIFQLQFGMIGLTGLILTCEAMGHQGEADEMLDLLQEFAGEGGGVQSIAIAASCRARVALWRGELGTAIRLLPPTLGPADAAALIYFVEVPWLTQCRVLLAKGAKDDVASATTMLADLRKGLEGLHNTCQVIEVMVLQAWAHDLMEESVKAKEILEAALQLAEPGWWIRPFLEAGEWVTALLGPDGGDDSPFRKELRKRVRKRQPTGNNRRVVPAEEPAVQSAPKQPLSEALTNREFDVLELIGQRLYDKEIAARLSISPQTVKAHLKHIYQKLGVGNRRAAVDRATTLESPLTADCRSPPTLQSPLSSAITCAGSRRLRPASS